MLEAMRDSHEVVRDLVDLHKEVTDARKVLIVSVGMRPRLVQELSRSLEGIGLIVVESNPKASPLCFADLVLPDAYEDQPESIYTELAEAFALLPEPEPEAFEPEPLPEVIPDPIPPHIPELPAPVVAKLDMHNPDNWALGDVFTENPRITLLYQRHRWVLVEIDVESDNVELKSPTTDASELMTLSQFVTGYVWVDRP